MIFAAVWPLRHRLKRPGDLAWLVLGLLAAGRFLEFFLRSDSPDLALGLDNAQWTSLVLLAIILAGRTVTTGPIGSRRRSSARCKARLSACGLRATRLAGLAAHWHAGASVRPSGRCNTPGGYGEVM